MSSDEPIFINEDAFLDGIALPPEFNVHNEELARCVAILEDHAIKARIERPPRTCRKCGGGSDRANSLCRCNEVRRYEPHRRAILLAGERGIGKTTFLKSLQGRLRGRCDVENEGEAPQGDRPRVHVLPILDPNLIDGDEVFLATVVANIIRELELLCGNRSACGGQDWERLRSCISELHTGLLASSNDTWKALMGSGSSTAQFGDHLQKLARGGIDTAARFEALAAEACHMLGVDLLVQPIDDVDLAGAEAWRAITVVHKFLTGASLVPILAADEANLEWVVLSVQLRQDAETMGWLRKVGSDDQRAVEEQAVRRRILDNRHQLLLKILPPHTRIRLASPRDRMLKFGQIQARRSEGVGGFPLLRYVVHAEGTESVLGRLFLEYFPQVSRVPAANMIVHVPKRTRSLVSFLRTAWRAFRALSHAMEDEQRLGVLAHALVEWFDLSLDPPTLPVPAGVFIGSLVSGDGWLNAAVLLDFRRSDPTISLEADLGGDWKKDGFAAILAEGAINLSLRANPARALSALGGIGSVWSQGDLAAEKDQPFEGKDVRQVYALNGLASAYITLQWAREQVNHPRLYTARPMVPVVSGAEHGVEGPFGSWANPNNLDWKLLERPKGANRYWKWRSLIGESRRELLLPDGSSSLTVGSAPPPGEGILGRTAAVLALFLVRTRQPPFLFLDVNGAFERLLHFSSREAENGYDAYTIAVTWMVEFDTNWDGIFYLHPMRRFQPWFEVQRKPPSGDSMRKLAVGLSGWWHSELVSRARTICRTDLSLIRSVAEKWLAAENLMGSAVESLYLNTIADFVEPCILSYFYVLLKHEVEALQLNAHRIGCDLALRSLDQQVDLDALVTASDDSPSGALEMLVETLAKIDSDHPGLISDIIPEGNSWADVLPLSAVLLSCPALRACLSPGWNDLLDKVIPQFEPGEYFRPDLDGSTIYDCLCGMPLHIGPQPSAPATETTST